MTFYGHQNITFKWDNHLIISEMFKYSFIYDFFNENEGTPETSIDDGPPVFTGGLFSFMASYGGNYGSIFLFEK